MARMPNEIETVAHAIYDATKSSSTPITMLGLEIMNLLKQPGWNPGETERVAGLVVHMLISDGWTNRA